MNTGKALARIAPEAETVLAVRSRKRRAPLVARVAILDPRKLAALRIASALGAELCVEFDGYSLTVTANVKAAE